MTIANWTCVSWVAYAPGTIAVNVTWIEREFNTCQTPRSMYPSIFNRFQVIQAVGLKVRHFCTFFAHFCFSCVRPWDNRDNHTVGKRIQCLKNASLYIPIYLQPFLRYSKLSVENCDIFVPPALFSGPAVGDPVGISRRSWYTQN